MKTLFTNVYVLGWTVVIALLLLAAAIWKRPAPSHAVAASVPPPPADHEPPIMKAPPGERRARPLPETSLRVNQVAGANTLERVREARKSRLRPDFLLLGKDLILTTAACRRLDLSSEDQDFVQKRIDQVLESARLETIRNIRPDPRRSDPARNIRAFVVDAFDFNPRFDAFAGELVMRFGKEKAGEILVGIPVESYFSDFGSCEAQFAVKELRDPDVPEAGFEVEIIMTQAETGKWVSRTNTFSSLISDRFPKVFNLEMQAAK